MGEAYFLVLVIKLYSVHMIGYQEKNYISIYESLKIIREAKERHVLETARKTGSHLTLTIFNDPGDDAQKRKASMLPLTGKKILS